MSTPTLQPVKLTRFQKRNLAKLALGLWRDKKRKTTFRMSSWPWRRGDYGIVLDISPSKLKNECGSTCCALGHAPLYCSRPKPTEGWTAYGRRIICPTSGGADAFWFLFEASWPDDVKQFAARAFLVLNGSFVPRGGMDFDYFAKYPVPRIKDLEAFL